MKIMSINGMARNNQADESSTNVQIMHALAGRIRVRLDRIHQDRPLANGLEKLLLAQHGVLAVRANVTCSSLVIEFEPGKFDPLPFLHAVDWHHVHRLENKSEALAPPPGLRKLMQATFAFEEFVQPKAQFALAGAGLVASVCGAPAVVTGTIISFAIAPILNRAIQSLLHERRLSADFLDGLTCVILIRGGSYFPAALMSSLISAGELIRDQLTQRCRKMIAHQLALSKRSAWLVKGNRRVRVPVIELHHGDLIVVYPGELIPCTGTVTKGKGRVVSALPDSAFAARDLGAGDHVDPDTILLDGKLYVQAQRIQKHESRNLIQEKQKTRWLQRTKLHRNALKAGHKAVIPVLGIAALFFALTRNLERSLSIITFDLITGIKITIPITVLSAMYRAGDSGVVMRNASVLESLAEVDTVVFARSGVLTSNMPIVTDLFVVEGFSRDQVTSYAAAIEQQYDHIAAYAIYSCVKEHQIKIPERTNSSLINGLGLKGEVDGHTVIVGRTKLLEMENIDLEPAKKFLAECEKRGDFRVCVAIDSKLAAVIAYTEPLRPEVAATIARLKELGVKEIAMMTGGSVNAAKALAKQAGIEKLYPRTLPEDQAKIVKDYRDRGCNVAVVGYDVDDALALEQANLAITLESGADVARHRADIVLASDNIRGLAAGIEIARSGMALAHQNLALVSTPNVFGFAMSLLRETDPVIATLMNNGSVMIGAANGLRPLLTGDDGEQDDEDIDDGAIEAETVALLTADQPQAAENQTLIPD
jgi:P-type E1-E2 ATPase